MNRSNPFRSNLSQALSGFGIAATLAAAMPVAASPIEHAVDVTGATGFVRLKYGDHTVNAGLASTLELDGYTFVGAAGDQFRIQLHTLTAGLDPSLVLRGTTGAVLATASCGGNNAFGAFVCSTSMTQTLPSNGTFTLNLSDINADEAGNYELHIERYPPVNNWVGVGYGTPNELNGSLDHFTDIDNFAFQGVAGTGVRLTLRTRTAGLDPVVELWGPNLASMTGASCGGNNAFGSFVCTASVDLNLTATGIYRISLSDSGLDEMGNYTLSVTCQFGECPTAAPSPVPEPQTFALLAGGLGMLGLALRRRRSVDR